MLVSGRSTKTVLLATIAKRACEHPTVITEQQSNYRYCYRCGERMK